uniref:Uncharacterized protein n=1 Tax=Angiostrongylus cantonensis TaxID=6313 RepID=A0A0K0DLN8_ANGCA
MRFARAAMLEQDKNHELRWLEKGTNGICAGVRTAREDGPSKSKRYASNSLRLASVNSNVILIETVALEDELALWLGRYAPNSLRLASVNSNVILIETVALEDEMALWLGRYAPNPLRLFSVISNVIVMENLCWI